VVVPGKHTVIYDFLYISSSVLITVPPDSAWESPPHWHQINEACECITVAARPDHLGPRVLLKLSRIPQIVDTRYLGKYNPICPLREIKVYSRACVAWKPYSEVKYGNQGHTTEVAIRTEDPAIARRMYCNLAGVSLDSSVYPVLGDTPALVRWLWQLARPCLWLQRGVEAVLLELQLSVILHANDFWLVRWTPQIGWLWWWRLRNGPPRWVPDLERSISNMNSAAILVVFAFIGRKTLGMRASYEEYDGQLAQGKEYTS
jgi:hypothetical protein